MGSSGLTVGNGVKRARIHEKILVKLFLLLKMAENRSWILILLQNLAMLRTE